MGLQLKAGQRLGKCILQTQPSRTPLCPKSRRNRQMKNMTNTIQMTPYRMLPQGIAPFVTTFQ